MLGAKPKFIRSATLDGYRKLATALGLDPAALLRRLNIDRRALNDPDLFISYRSFIELLDVSAHLAKRPDFGLRLSMGRGINVLGPLAVLALNEPDIGHTLTTISKYLHIHNDGLRVQLRVLDGIAQLSLFIDIGVPSSTRQIMELSIGGIVNFMRLLLGQDWNPSDTYFTHSAPADMSLHKQIFRCPVYFNQDFNGFTFEAGDTTKKVRNADEFTRRYMLNYIQSIEQQHGDDLVSIARRVISDIVSSGRCNKTLIAGYMAMEPRTLQRRLAARGYSFRQLIEEVRGGMAVQFLADSHKSLSEIAEMVGYSELSAFTRFFQRIYGISPSEWRSKNILNRLA